MDHSHTALSAGGPETAPVGAGATAAAPGRLRLTRRGRLLLLGVPALAAAAALMLGAALMVGGLVNQAQASTEASVGVDAREVIVAPGDTLWDIASEVDSTEDTDELILRIAELNDLDGSTLQPGQRLDVPVGG
ncbi:LysM peptidoglycan-binding domain-containing protein [Nesterenkonia sp. F]|uniref:LysM peptidoglycan-binding domain-containing protein n=1 Tax=Nesterenkonia sp. F TaxID=795955 RepID=UPI000255CB36|nr:LysM peptidoglycan-binding domain-containing protein [Nesterenkonia sp. F]